MPKCLGRTSETRHRVRGWGRCLGVAGLLIGAITITPPEASAHQDPLGCSAVGVDFAIEGFRADRVTPIALDEVVSECETVCVRAMLAKPGSDEVCAFEGGTVTIITPAGSTVVAMPADIPCLGGNTTPCILGTNVKETDFACFQVTAAGTIGGQVSVTASYTGGTAHTREGNQANAVAAGIGRSFAVENCPADTICRDNFCNPTLTDGGRTGLCTFTNQPSTTICRAAAGVCDVAEFCTGTSPDCPADGFASAATVCRAQNGVCDVAETCPGNGPNCPADGFASAATVCRASAGICDVAETCPGNGPNCPADGFASAATVCRASAGVCDVAENCPGNAPSCPPDGVASPATGCRPAPGT